MSNTLAGATSPYLQQHADNPVNWVPWSPEALARAAAEDKPLLISIGYSSCHWCHVMARESFSDEAVAAIMNEHFVCVKVDREERPDVDAIYMDAMQHLSGPGGWPLNVFALPDGRPFYAGSYFPPSPRGDQPSWTMLIEAIVRLWRDRREEAETTGEQIVERLSGAIGIESASEVPDESVLEDALASLQKAFDSVNGGFGTAPKFPPSTVIGLLLRLHSLPMARYTLTSMASGGIFDQLGGGFSRYAVDAAWAVPHFEKMLFDNAQLAARYVEATDATGDERFGQIAERTLDWVIRDLGDEDGAFASALDADLGGVEGAYYTWTVDQVREVLGDEDAQVAIDWFGVTDAGDLEGGQNVLRAQGEAPEGAQADRIVSALLAARETRERPFRDGKRIVSWNALTIEALVKSGISLGRADHLEAAVRCAELLLERAADPRGEGRLLRLIPVGDSEGERDAIPSGVLDDHSHTLSALIALYEATFETRWLTAARTIADACLTQFADPDGDGFFTTAHDHEQLITRRKDLDDSPIPSGGATAALAMLRLHALTGEDRWRSAAEGVIKLTVGIAANFPQNLAQLLIALDQYLATPTEIAIVGEGPEAEALIAVAREHADPHAVIAAGAPSGDLASDVPLLAGRGLVDDKATAYVCSGFSCLNPVTS
ncbi:MAG: thioredoxin domain-containing protein, partial [Solirubrobacteraceae bacterium]|nr:thioredoxin domain-containing protein [Solirubrobacteraceae bacterium]